MSMIGRTFDSLRSLIALEERVNLLRERVETHDERLLDHERRLTWIEATAASRRADAEPKLLPPTDDEDR